MRQFKEGVNSALIQGLIKDQVSPNRSNKKDWLSIHIIIVQKEHLDNQQQDSIQSQRQGMLWPQIKSSEYSSLVSQKISFSISLS